MQYHVVQYHVVQYHVVQYHVVQYHVVQYQQCSISSVVVYFTSSYYGIDVTEL